jgi:hypothetical protein
MKKCAQSGVEFRLPLYVYMVCCDCGLKHVHRYRIERKGARNYLYLTAWRSNYKRWKPKR